MWLNENDKVWQNKTCFLCHESEREIVLWSKKIRICSLTSPWYFSVSSCHSPSPSPSPITKSNYKVKVKVKSQSLKFRVKTLNSRTWTWSDSILLCHPPPTTTHKNFSQQPDLQLSSNFHSRLTSPRLDDFRTNQEPSPPQIQLVTWRTW